MKKITLLDERHIRENHEDIIAFRKLTDSNGNEIYLGNVVPKNLSFNINESTFNNINDDVYGELNVENGVAMMIEEDRATYRTFMSYARQIGLDDYIPLQLYTVEDVEEEETVEDVEEEETVEDVEEEETVEDVEEPKVEINPYFKYGFSFILGVITTLFIKKRI